MEYRPLGRCGLVVSAIGRGGTPVGSSIDGGAADTLIRTALDLGVTFIDTAVTYTGGRSDEAIGRARLAARTSGGSSVIAGIRTVEQLRQNLRALDVALDPGERGCAARPRTDLRPGGRPRPRGALDHCHRRGHLAWTQRHTRSRIRRRPWIGLTPPIGI